MDMRHMKNIGKNISLLGFGCMRYPQNSDDKKDINVELAQKMVDLAIKGGVNYFDTAWGYHDEQSERVTGMLLKKYPRESFYLADKMPIWLVKSRDDLERLFNEQLRRCQVDYFDFYLLHCLTRTRYPLLEQYGMHDFLERKKREGRIRHMGFSFHDEPDLLARAVNDHAWDFAQIQVNYVDWTICDARGQYEILAGKNIPVVVMEPVRGGALASLNPEAADLLRRADPSASAASWGLRFAASLPGVMTVLSGMSDLTHVEDNLKTMSPFRPLSDDERETLDRASTAYLASGTIPCTACRYCMDCPSGVDIPRVFGTYNHYCAYNNAIFFRNTYNTLRDGEKAHNCTGCGACLNACPQHIDIPGRMKEIAAFVAAM